jgi:hypothetical protein
MQLKIYPFILIQTRGMMANCASRFRLRDGEGKMQKQPMNPNKKSPACSGALCRSTYGPKDEIDEFSLKLRSGSGVS